jgi:hypothetical protein
MANKRFYVIGIFLSELIHSLSSRRMEKDCLENERIISLSLSPEYVFNNSALRVIRMNFYLAEPRVFKWFKEKI